MVVVVVVVGGADSGIVLRAVKLYIYFGMGQTLTRQSRTGQYMEVTLV